MTSMLRSNLIVASGTALSRLTGLLRIVVLAYVLGQTALADAYKLSNETPNIVYDLLIGGVLSATLVPLFSTFVEEEDDESTNVVLTVATALMAALTVVAVLAAPLIFRLYSLNVDDAVDPDVFRSVGTTLTRIFLIQILFYGLVGLANAFLNSRRRFFAAAWSPILPNLIIVLTLLSLPNAGTTDWQLQDVLDDNRLRLTLSLGATVGIASMAVVLLPAMRATRFRFRPNLSFRHPVVKRLLRMSTWTIGFVIANQIALIVIRNLADPGSGDASAYFEAFTFFVLPHGLLAVSIATTFQPEMSRAVARRDREAFVDQTSIGIRMTALLTIPAGIGIFVLRQPIVGAFLQHGTFTSENAYNTSRALAGLALGLGAFSIYLFVLRGFYAHKDTKTAFIVNVFENSINIGLAFLLVDRYGVLGLGLAFALAYLFGSIWALRILTNKVRGFNIRGLLESLWRIVLATAIMGEVVWLVARQVGGNVGLEAAARVTVGTIAGVAVYLIVLAALQAPELSAVRKRLPGR
ncbi:MAG: murein biosynthesis integral membrane protein MurJ [Ilumatobacteraceae bacterium]|nr:murein biosynthesis integral membrane protein MurJ [Ilumatobacteraceae bacterium]